MLQKLKNFLNTFYLFNSARGEITASIPHKISDNERIARAIYSPINLHKNGEKLNNNFYKPKAGEDEISVNRLDHTTPAFLKELAKFFESPIDRRNYFGFSLLKASEIESSGLRIVYSPLNKPKVNLFHADIKIDYVVESGVPLPAEISYKIKNITDKSRFYRDPNPNLKEWNGDILI